jgi:hypothetical protein
LKIVPQAGQLERLEGGVYGLPEPYSTPCVRDIRVVDDRIGDSLKVTLNTPSKGGQLIAVIVVGLLAFALWGGAHVLSPKHFGWLMTIGDTPGQYLGWEYFRRTPWWQWPLGANPNYGRDAPGTIVMSDSIPVAAFFFKLWRAWLPVDFQYFGIWALSCFVMQAWFGYRVMQRLFGDFWLSLLGCGFFVTATIFVVRVYMHPALAAQWVLLAAIYLGLDKRPRTLAWWLLLLFTTLVHAYLLVMVAALWVACMFHHARVRSMTPLAVLGYAFAVVCSIVLTMWAAGYFVPEAVVPQTTRSYANLLTPVWPGFCREAQRSQWSWVMPCTPFESMAVAMVVGDGFGYFGLGYLALAATALVLLGLGKKPSPGWSGGIWPMAAVSLLLVVYAFGDRIYAGTRLLFTIHWPGVLDSVAHVFRGAGRMMWPAWYLCLFMVLSVVVCSLGVKRARWVLLLALLVQCADMSMAPVEGQRAIKERTAGIAQLVSPQWVLLDRQYRHAVFIRPHQLTAYLVGWSLNYRRLALRAAHDGLSVNIGYLSRVNEPALDAAQLKREALLLSGQAEPSTFYVIDDSDLWQSILCAPDHGQWHGVLDGALLLVPNPPPNLKLPPASVSQACAGKPA